MSEAKMKRTPLLYLSCGFIGGVIISRNAAPLSGADKGAVVLGLLIMAWFAFRSGVRGKAEAVATAVATAVSISEANATAKAQATAQQAVQIVLQREGIHATPHDVRTLWSDSVRSIEVDESAEYKRIEAEEYDHETTSSR